jgi:hypothetical protein
MAKKSRRIKKKGRQVRLSPTQMAQPGMGEAVNAATGGVQARPESEGNGLQEPYRYVVADLKRMGIIAAEILVVLVVLAFLLT